jgi:hypothetical protein
MSLSQALSRPRGLLWRLRWDRASPLLDGATVGVVALIAWVIAQAPITSGDFGQWLMVSRYYSGESVPGYRDISGVAPLVPALLALVRVPVSDPEVALGLLRLMVLACVVTGLYAAGWSLFRSRGAGLLSVVVAFTLTERLLELFAFGGLLQLASIGLMVLGVAFLAQAGHDGRHERATWVAGAAVMSLAVLAHAGSTVIVLPVALAVGSVSVGRSWRRRTAPDWLRFLLPAAFVPILTVAFWVLVLVPANAGYVDNPAVASYRGADVLWDALTRDAQGRALLTLGTLALVVGSLREVLTRRPGGYCSVSAWAAASWAVLGLVVLTGTPTDYPRFAAPLLTPLIIGLAGGVRDTCWALSRARGSTATSARMEHGLVVLTASLGLLVFGPGQLELLDRYSSFYGVRNRESVSTLAQWADERMAPGETILTLEPRDGKWVEGLTGRAALFANETRYSFRSDEWDRNIAADAMVRSTTTLVNGLVEARFLDVTAGVPQELLIGMNHDGEWAEFIRLPESGSKVLDGQQTLASLGALDAVSVERFDDGNQVVVRTVYGGEREGVPLTWTRTVSIQRHSPVIDILDEVDTDAPASGMVIALTPFGPPMELSKDSPRSALLAFPRMGSRKPELEVRVVGGLAKLERVDAGLQVRVAGATRVHTQFRARTTGDSISSLAMLYPPQVVEDFRIGAVLLRRDGAFEERLLRLQAIGFCPARESGGFVLLMAVCTAAPDTSVPGPATGGPVPGQRMGAR